MKFLFQLLGSIFAAFVFLLFGRGKWCDPKPRQLRVVLFAHLPNGSTEEGNFMQNVIRNDEKVEYEVRFLDAFDNVADTDGTPVWSSSDESIATVVAGEDGLTAIVTPTGKKGVTQIDVLADADTSAGTKEMLGSATLTVLSGQAVRFELLSRVIPAPVVTQAPEPTPEPTPAPTPEPEVTPEPTAAPVEPEPTDAPEVTDAPADPEVTSSPEVTAEPEVTEQPQG